MNKVEIAPSILSADFGNLIKDIKEVEPYCRFLHLDIMDGHFVPNYSFGIPVLRSIRGRTDMIFDCHLMIAEPERYVESFAACGCDYITFHIECCDDPSALCKKIRNLGKRPGIAISPGTPVEDLFPYLPDVDLVLIMSVIPGFGGQSYMAGANERIRSVRAELDRISSDAILSVDGGINSKTAREAYESGATLLVSGNSVFANDDHAKAVQEMLECALQ